MVGDVGKFGGPRNTDDHRWEVSQRKSAQLRRWFEARHRNGKTDTISAGNITFDQSRRVDFDSAKPFHSEPLKAALKIWMHRISPWKSDKLLLDLVAFPQLFSVRQLGFFVDQENQRQFEQWLHLNCSARFFVD